MKDPAIIALESLGHVKIESTRCRYRSKAVTDVPGPCGVPIWCDLQAGHDGPHKYVSGHGMVQLRESTLEMGPLIEVCKKCGVRWPCKDAETVINAFTDPEPCVCYPEHCTDTSHGECWCNPAREGNLIIHNQGA